MGPGAGRRNAWKRNIAIRLSFAYPGDAFGGGPDDDDQAAEAGARLPARVHRPARLCADARGDRPSLPARLPGHGAQAPPEPAAQAPDKAAAAPRSEERRVGKECRSQWGTHD